MAAINGEEMTASMQAEAAPDGTLLLRYSGRLDSQSTAALWRETTRALKENGPSRVVVEADGVNYCDGSGLGLLLELQLRGRKEDFALEVRGLSAEFERLLNMFDAEKFAAQTGEKPPPTNIAEEVGMFTVSAWTDFAGQIAFVGKLCSALGAVALRPRQVRWKDAFLTVERAGVNAVGIIALIGFLFGLIVAFSSAMPLRQFGADIYVADLTALALVRVLGPFITAIIFAGRSGSAFAAELGTMKINYEIDALKTMGLDPVKFLVVPKALATVAIIPLLTVLANLSGLVGAVVVLLSLGFPLVTCIEHIRSAITAGDVVVGLVKAVVFGALVSGVSCLRGLQTRTGASAVGISTTRAVVSSIVLLVIAEGVFAVLLYCLDI